MCATLLQVIESIPIGRAWVFWAVVGYVLIRKMNYRATAQSTSQLAAQQENEQRDRMVWKWSHEVSRSL
jgi:hypothetical protein